MPHCVSGRSSVRLFEPVMDLAMDLLLPDSLSAWGASDTIRDLAPPVSPLLSRLMSLLDGLDPADSDEAINTENLPGASSHIEPLMSKRQQEDIIAKVENTGNLSSDKEADVWLGGITIGEKHLQHDASIRSSTQLPNELQANDGIVARAVTAAAMLDLPPIPLTNQHHEDHMRRSEPRPSRPNGNDVVNVIGQSSAPHTGVATLGSPGFHPLETAMQGFSDAFIPFEWSSPSVSPRSHRKISGKVIASGKCRLVKVVSRTKMRG